MIQNTTNIAFCGGKLPNFKRTTANLYTSDRYRGVPNFDNPQYIAPKKSVLKEMKQLFSSFINTILNK